MAAVPRRVSVTTAATRLDADPTDRASGSSVVLIAQGTGTLCLGPSDVTAATGARVACVAGTIISADLSGGESLYGIVASSTLAVDVLLLGA